MFFKNHGSVNLGWDLAWATVFNQPMIFGWLLNSNLYTEYGQHAEK